MDKGFKNNFLASSNNIDVNQEQNFSFDDKDKDSVIRFVNLSMKYKKNLDVWALNHLNFVVKKGDFHAFLGSNGAGKSTTIKILVGLNNDFEGNLFINNQDVKLHKGLRKNFCFVPDTCKFPSDFTLEQYIYNDVLLVRNDIEKINKDLNMFLKLFEMENYRKKNANRLSAGERQKVSLIRALLEKPSVLILDEPFSNLDPKSRFQWMKLLKQVNERYQMTIFMSSHIINDLVGFVDSATFIEKGQILFNGKIKKEELKDKYFNFVLKNNNLENYEF